MYQKLACLTVLGLMLAVASGVGAEELGQGKVLFEYWTGIGGTSVNDNLRTNANFPDNPNSSEWRDSFKSKVDWADNTGTRARAFLAPPETGEYTFWVSGDDNCQLWLSTDDSAANATMIAQVASWTGVEEWGKEAGQESAPVALEAGQKYYVEALMKEGGGGDSVTVGWAGPGIGEATTVIAGQYLTAFIRTPEPLLQAQSPDAPDGAVDVFNPLFTWKPGITAAMHEIYFGTNPEPGPDEYKGPMALGAEIYYHMPGLTPGETYYWRIDEVDAAGNKYVGKVWSFSVMPLTAHFPSPYDGALWRQTNITVSWTAGQGAVSHRVYGDTDQAAVAAGDPGALLGELAETSLDASALLEPANTYFWRVDEIDATGAVHEGPVWTFSTYDPAGGAVAEYWNNTALSGAPVVVTTVGEVNFNWGSGSAKGTNSPDPAINTNNFSCRWTADLNVPVSGTYRLYDATDDGGRLFLNGEKIAEGWYNRGTTEDASAEIELVAGGQYQLVMEMYEAGGGTAAFLRWSGPGIPKEIIPQGALQIPKGAISPSPANNEVEVSHVPVLSWTAGAGTTQNLIYLGTDKAQIAASDMSLLVGTVAESSFIPAALDWNTTYYWKVDNITGDGIVPGVVWTFTTADFLVVNLPQVTLNYDNGAEPCVSELAFDVPSDWTINGVTDLALRFQGRAGVSGDVAYDEATGVYQVTGAGADVWGSSDQFTYAYKTLTGDGEIIAQVTSNGTGTNNWAKGGVMVRETLAANSKHMIMALTGGDGGGIGFQGRPQTGGNSSSLHGDVTAGPPCWVKLTREGNAITAYYSADGAEWTLMTDTSPDNSGGPMSNPIDVEMAETVYIGLFVTSHAAGELRTFTFENVSTAGGIPEGPFANWTTVGLAYNAPAPLYVALEDATGATAAVVHPDAAAVNATAMGLWRIPLSAFAGVDLTSIAKAHVGVGDGQCDAGLLESGVMNFADIRVLRPATEPAADAVDVTAPGDAVIGQPNDGDWPGGEYPDLAIDDNVNTKFLHFKGETQPSGIVVTPAIGGTIVTGLTFTTANDASGRDPVGFELYGSNKGVDGPWALIAEGAIDDFARPIAWPRFTKNVTPIGFANSVPYAHYKVMVTAVRAPGSANSMQVAEVELLGTVAEAAGPIVVWVSFHAADDAPSGGAAGAGFTEAPDKGYTDLLKANGYNVVRYVQTKTPDKDMLAAAANLVIVSRSVASSSFQNDAATTWNTVAVPMIVLNGYTARQNRMGYYTGRTIPDTTGDIKLMINDPTHPIFAGISLTDCTMTNPYAGVVTYPDGTTLARGISIVTEPVNAEGTVLAVVSDTAAATGPVGATVIAEWPAGATLTHAGGAGTDTLAGPRLLFVTGSRETSGISSQTAGMYDLYADGAQMLLNAVAYMLQ